jgi:hypothetical protein
MSSILGSVRPLFCNSDILCHVVHGPAKTSTPCYCLYTCSVEVEPWHCLYWQGRKRRRKRQKNAVCIRPKLLYKNRNKCVRGPRPKVKVAGPWFLSFYGPTAHLLPPGDQISSSSSRDASVFVTTDRE